MLYSSLLPPLISGMFGIVSALVAARLAARSERKRFERDLTLRLAELQRDFASQYAAAVATSPKHAETLRQQFAGAYLFIRNPELTVSDRRFIPRSARTTVGRSESCDLVVPTSLESVSQIHAMFEFVDDVLYVTDLNSMNGTCVAGERVNGRARVEDGASVRIGSLETIVKLI